MFTIRNLTYKLVPSFLLYNTNVCVTYFLFFFIFLTEIMIAAAPKGSGKTRHHALHEKLVFKETHKRLTQEMLFLLPCTKRLF